MGHGIPSGAAKLRDVLDLGTWYHFPRDFFGARSKSFALNPTEGKLPPSVVRQQQPVLSPRVPLSTSEAIAPS